VKIKEKANLSWMMMMMMTIITSTTTRIIIDMRSKVIRYEMVF
jgi:hypothetical protein